MRMIINPPPWRLQPAERDLLLREVRALTGRGARWHNDAVVIDGNMTTRQAAALAERIAFARSVVGDHRQERLTRQHLVEVAVGGGTRKVTSHALHGLHPYKGKFYPQLARSILNSCGLRPGARVLDPFAGCGTTVLEADLLNIAGFGLDSNPLAVLVANTKIRALRRDPSTLRASLTKLRRLPKIGAPLPDSYLERWFPAENLDFLLRAMRGIAQLADADARALALVSLSSVLRRCSCQDPRQLRVYRRAATDDVPQLADEFAAALATALENLEATQRVYGSDALRHRSGRVDLGDARRGTPPSIGKFDAIVTSPPYANALPYIDTDRLSLRAFGLLGADGQRGAERQMIGNREITERELVALNAEADRALGRRLLPNTLAALLQQTREVAAEASSGFRKRRTPGLLYAYFRDMDRVLGVLRPRVADGATAVFVIGDSAVAGPNGSTLPVPTADIIAEQAERRRFKLTDRLGKRLTSFGASDTRHQRNAMADEEVLIFQAS
jgi:site-specific DNA-methyltransferase (cytosine-N4-specific)